MTFADHKKVMKDMLQNLKSVNGDNRSMKKLFDVVGDALDMVVKLLN